MYASPEEAFSKYEFESTHPRAVEVEEIEGWWDVGTAYETQRDTDSTVTHAVYQENVSITVAVTVYDRDRGVARATGHELATAVFDEAAEHLVT